MHILDKFYEQLKTRNDVVVLKNSSQNFSFENIDIISDNVRLFIDTNFNGEEEIVPICIHNDIMDLPVFIGIFKSGRVVLPLPTTLSIEENINRISDISHTPILIDWDCDSASTVRLPELDLSALRKVDFDIQPRNENVEIVMTSGSTGVPKKILLSNKNLESFFEAYNEIFHCDENSRLIFSTTYAFDVSMAELYAPIYYGCTLTCFDRTNSEYKIMNFAKMIEKNKITHISAVPTMAGMFLEADTESDISSVEYFGFAGEKLYMESVIKVHKRAPKARLLNLYGPAEATIYSTYYEVKDFDLDDIPVGTPLSNGTLVISTPNESGNGEIFIGGNGVADGYLVGDNSKFVKDENGMQWYHTGDYGFYKDDILYFTGRKDGQYKVNGIRIELDELLYLCRQVEEVSDARLGVLNGCVYAFMKLKSPTEKEEIYRKIREKVTLNITIRVAIVDQFITNLNGKFDVKKMIEKWFSDNDSDKYEDEVSEYINKKYNAPDFESLNSIQKIRTVLFFCDKYKLKFSEQMLYSKAVLMQTISEDDKYSNEKEIMHCKNKFLDAFSNCNSDVFYEKEPNITAPLLYYHKKYVSNLKKYSCISVSIKCSSYTVEEIVGMISTLMKRIDLFSITINKSENGEHFAYKKFTANDYFVYSESEMTKDEVDDRFLDYEGKSLFCINYVSKTNMIHFYFTHLLIDLQSSQKLLSYANAYLTGHKTNVPEHFGSYMHFINEIANQSIPNGNKEFDEFTKLLDSLSSYSLEEKYSVYRIPFINSSSEEAIAMAFYCIYSYLKTEKNRGSNFCSAAIMESQKYSDVMGDTHITMPLVASLKESCAFKEILKMTKDSIHQAEFGINHREALSQAGEESVWDVLPFVINYLGETGNAKREINYYNRYHYAKKYVLSLTAEGYLYFLFFADFINHDFSLEVDGELIPVEKIR